MQRLLEIGFEQAGEWMLIDGDPSIELRRYENAGNVLYAFVAEDELLYIGRAGRSLRQRMDGYQSGGPPRSTRERNRERIIAMLIVGQVVEVYAMPDPGSLHFGSFRLNLAAGLQQSLQTALDPPWNRAATAAPPVSTPAPARKRRSEILPVDDPFTDLTIDRPSYRFLVGYMYLSKGFFNVPTRYSRLFGSDQDHIRILCGGDKVALQGRIDRSANTNATPRVLGGAPLKRWFEEHVGLNKPVDIDILAPNAVWLRKPKNL